MKYSLFFAALFLSASTIGSDRFPSYVLRSCISGCISDTFESGEAAAIYALKYRFNYLDGTTPVDQERTRQISIHGGSSEERAALEEAFRKGVSIHGGGSREEIIEKVGQIEFVQRLTAGL